MKYIIQRIPKLPYITTRYVNSQNFLTPLLSEARQFAYKNKAKVFLWYLSPMPINSYSIIKVSEKELFKAKLAGI